MTEGDTEGYVVEGEPALPKGQFNDALYREVTPGYLEAIGANLQEGRMLEGSDRVGGLNVVVVNEFQVEAPSANACASAITKTIRKIRGG
jgi:hypothetical protein